MPIAKSKPALAGDCGESLLPDTVDLRSLCWMKLDMCRIHGSDFVHLADNEEFGAALKLWMASMRQVPAGSLPNNDRIIASLAGYANAPRRWTKVRDMALYGWIPCNDGRLYHPVISEMVLEVQGSKGAAHHALQDGKEDAVADRRRKNRERVQRWRKARAEAADQAADVEAESPQNAPAVRPTVTPDALPNVTHVMHDVTRYDVTRSVTVMRYSNDVILDKIKIERENEIIYKQAVTPSGVTALQRNGNVTRDVMRNVMPDVTRNTDTADTDNLPGDSVQAPTNVPENKPLPPETDLPFQEATHQDGAVTPRESSPENALDETVFCTESIQPESVLENHHDVAGDASVQVDEKNFFQCENFFESSVQETVHENVPEQQDATGSPSTSSETETSDAQDTLWDLFLQDEQTVDAVGDDGAGRVEDLTHDRTDALPVSIPASEEDIIDLTPSLYSDAQESDDAAWEGEVLDEDMKPGDEQAVRALSESMKRVGLSVDQEDDEDEAPDAQDNAAQETDADATTRPNARLGNAVREALGEVTDKAWAPEGAPDTFTSDDVSIRAQDSRAKQQGSGYAAPKSHHPPEGECFKPGFVFDEGTENYPLPAPGAKNGSRFAEFWAAYPKKVGRKPCEKKWKARKLDRLADVILADIAERAQKDYRWLDGYFLNPETYLNGDRWEDDILLTSQRPSQKSSPNDAKRQEEDEALKTMFGKNVDPSYYRGMSKEGRQTALNMVDWMRSKGVDI